MDSPRAFKRAPKEGLGDEAVAEAKRLVDDFWAGVVSEGLVFVTESAAPWSKRVAIPFSRALDFKERVADFERERAPLHFKWSNFQTVERGGSWCHLVDVKVVLG